MPTNGDVQWHALETEEALSRVESSPDGLSPEEAQRRLEEHGGNELTGQEGISPFRLLLRQVHNPLIYLLFGAAVVSVTAGHLVDAGVIMGVVVLNTLLGFVQEWRAEGALAALREMSAPRAQVLRGGATETVDARTIVPGDVLVLETGDRVAADARMLQAEDLHVDESALTGESQPVAKGPSPVDPDTPMADRCSMVWMSTNVTGGRGRAVVAKTGMDTEMGHIAGEVQATRREKTPLQKRMHKLSVFLGILGVALAALVFVVGLLADHEFVEMLLFSVAAAVSAIPEGLPAVISVTLALGVRRMADRHAIVRRLPAVETLGSITTICSDKTGTITRNQMTVRRLWAGERFYETTGEGYEPEGEIRTDEGEALDQLPEDLAGLLRIGALANNALLKEEDGTWTVQGSPSEGALLAVARKAGLDTEQLAQEADRIHEIPFSSARQYMATLHLEEDREQRVLLVKGAPDRLLDYCSHIQVNGERVEMDDRRREQVEEVARQFADEAMRVMAGAWRDVEQDKDRVEEEDAEYGLTLVGLWAMLDPPRDESVEAVAEAKRAGIRPIMITGDHAATALAIARRVGIAEDGKALSADDVDGLEPHELAEAALRDGVFARVTPAHKLKIMQSLKDHGQVVAMTGDGVNDAPALKGADIGVAMGQAGTEVAKEAADMVLTDDNFATIVHAIEEGRVIFSNLQRVVFFLLSTNVGEILTLIGALLLGLDLPLTAVMILWVNLVTDGACTVPLGVEPRHGDVLDRPPRDPRAPILDWALGRRMAILTLVMAAGTLALFWYQSGAGSLEHARTVAFTTMAAFQWFQAFNARSRYQSVFRIGFARNRWVMVGLGTAVALQVLVVHTGLGRLLFGTTSLSAFDWLLIVLVSSSIWVVDELMKLFGVHGSRAQSTRPQGATNTG
ncbi:MAG: HAD-IC family P-type ATPase [Candidatus Brocadiia bacterium]